MATEKTKNPDSLFNICSKVVKENSKLEKQLFECYPHNLNFVYTHEMIIKSILRTVDYPYLVDNKTFERFFRKLIKDHIFVSENVKEMLAHTRFVKRKIESFKKIYGVVKYVYYDILTLEEILEMLV